MCGGWVYFVLPIGGRRDLSCLFTKTQNEGGKTMSNVIVYRIALCLSGLTG